jgi:hypothetical protein
MSSASHSVVASCGGSIPPWALGSTPMLDLWYVDSWSPYAQFNFYLYPPFPGLGFYFEGGGGSNSLSIYINPLFDASGWSPSEILINTRVIANQPEFVLTTASVWTFDEEYFETSAFGADGHLIIPLTPVHGEISFIYVQFDHFDEILGAIINYIGYTGPAP